MILRSAVSHILIISTLAAISIISNQIQMPLLLEQAQAQQQP
jgi:hypothetical protein